MKKQTPKTPTHKANRQDVDNSDIVSLILQDHVILKDLIEIMKDEEASFSEKKAAFAEFAPNLVRHAKPEEQTWYMRMKAEDMNVEGIEGDVEHMLADQLCESLDRIDDEDEFKANVKVLAELVEHHIEEEEEEMLPEFKKMASTEERQLLGAAYLQLQEEMDAMGDDDSPSEALLYESGEPTAPAVTR